MRIRRRGPWLLVLVFVCAASGTPWRAIASGPNGTLSRRLASQLEAGTTSDLHDVIVVLRDRAAADRFAGSINRPVHRFDALPMVRLFLRARDVAAVGRLKDVRFIDSNHPLQLANDIGRLATGAEQVQQDLGYTGDGVDVAIIDTGIDAAHPDLDDGIARHWIVAQGCPSNLCEPDPIPGPRVAVGSAPSHLGLQVGVFRADHDAGVPFNSDLYGHGTHVAGTVAGSGDASDGRLRGMAPGARLHVYATAIGPQLLWVLEAYDHIIQEVREEHADIRIINLSLANDICEFGPFEPMNVASRMAAVEGILSVWAMGNYGAYPGTCSGPTTAPYVLGVGATRERSRIASFSSRGWPGRNHDREAALANLEAFLAADDATRAAWDYNARPIGLFRPGIVAHGVGVMSTTGVASVLNTNSLEANPYYGLNSGTSMSTPAVSGVAALVIEAYEENNPGKRLAPIDLIRLLEVTADRDPLIGALAFEGGAGVVDAVEAVSRAASGDIPTSVTAAHLLPETLPPADVIQSFAGRVLSSTQRTNIGYRLYQIPVELQVSRVDVRVHGAQTLLRMYPPGQDPDAAFVFRGQYDFGENAISLMIPQPGVWTLRVDGAEGDPGGPFTGVWEIRFL